MEDSIKQIGPHPLLNIHIVEIIFQQCSISTLLNCRLVCQTWNSEALRIMERDGATALVKGDNAIEKFFDCMLQSSESQPYSSFSIELSAVAMDEQFQLIYDLILLLKDRMKHVRFDYEMPTKIATSELEESEKSSGEITNFLTMCPITLPILTSLHLFSTNIFPPKSPNRLPTLFNLLKTPHLSSLSVQHLYETNCASTVVKFLKSSESQISSLRIPCTEFPKVVEDMKTTRDLWNLKELDICDLFHGSFATNETLSCIQQHCPNLQILAIELGIRVTFDAVFKMLETLSHSLVTLKLIIQDKNLLSRNIQRVNFYFPHMPKLSSLFLRFANPGLVYFIEELPLLSSLELETPWTRKVRGQLFPGVNSKVYGKLQTLNLSEKLTAPDVLIIRQLFPNLKTICSSFKSDEALLEVYQNYSELLEVLFIDRNSSITDTGITGLSSEILSKFSEEGPWVFNTSSPILNKDGEISISNLRRLKSLKLVQLGLSWKSLVLGVSHLKNLESLAVQATTLKIGGVDLLKDDRVLKHLSEYLPKLHHLSIWIRRNSERLSQADMQFLCTKYPQWRIELTIQTVCSVT